MNMVFKEKTFLQADNDEPAKEEVSGLASIEAVNSAVEETTVVPTLPRPVVENVAIESVETFKQLSTTEPDLNASFAGIGNDTPPVTVEPSKSTDEITPDTVVKTQEAEVIAQIPSPTSEVESAVEDAKIIKQPATVVKPEKTPEIVDQEIRYEEKVESYLREARITYKQRLLLDDFLEEADIDYDQADKIENAVRTRLGVKPRNWIKEYKHSCYVLKNQYAKRIPIPELEKLNTVYVVTDRVSAAQAKDITKRLGMDKSWKNSYRWLAILLGGVAAAAVIVMQIPTLSDGTQPTGDVLEIKETYPQGAEISYIINASDNVGLAEVGFTVNGAQPIKQTWQVNDKTVQKQGSFSTKNWEANKRYTYTLFIKDKGGNTIEKSNSFHLAETIPPIAKIRGINPTYIVGDKVSYAIEATDETALKNITFSVENSSANYNWDISGKKTIQTSFFSTKGFTPGTYNYVLKVVDLAGNLALEKGSFILTPSPEQLRSQPMVPGIPGSTATNTAAPSNPLQHCQSLKSRESALSCYQKLLTQDPTNIQVKMEITKIASIYQGQLEQALSNRQIRRSRELLNRLELADPNVEALPDLKEKVIILERQRRDMSTVETPVTPPAVVKPAIVERPRISERKVTPPEKPVERSPVTAVKPKSTSSNKATESTSREEAPVERTPSRTVSKPAVTATPKPTTPSSKSSTPSKPVSSSKSPPAPKPSSEESPLIPPTLF